MLLQDKHTGSGSPFEGDLTLWLRSLPAGASATKASITLEQTGFEEVIDFGNQATFGATKISDSSSTFVEVDFHARRTLVSIEGSVTGTGPNLQVDMGGTYIAIAKDGTFMGPGHPDPFPVTFSSGVAPLPGLTVSKFRLFGASDTRLTVSRVHIRSFPTNVSVRLGQLPAFWTRPGELAAADTSPDFAAVLNAVLATAQPQNGFYAIPFVIHSDTLAQLDVTLRIEYVIAQPVLPSYLPEVTMSYAFSPQPDLDPSLMKVTLPKGAVPVSTATSAQVRGVFQPTRIALKAESASPIVANVVVSPDCSLAQPLRSDKEIALTGIDLPLSKALPNLAGLNVAIQADNDGKPSGQVLIRADLVVGKPLPDQSAWGSATLPAPFRILANTSYWLVLESLAGQSVTDQVAWIAAPSTSSDLALQCSRDNGLSWRPANALEALAPLSAQFRLRNIPSSFTIPIQLDIGTKPGDVLRSLDEFAPLGRVELTFGFGDALGQYVAKQTAASPCGTEDLVINGDFSDPPPDDAAMKLFGVEYKQGGDTFTPTVTLGPRIDLSVERFVTLSDDTSPPSIQPTRIDCAGSNPAQTTPVEIINAIQKKIGDRTVTLIQGNQLNFAPTAVLYPWCKKQVPSGWQGTTNQTYRLKIPDGSNRTVVMLADPASLDQSQSPNQFLALSIDQWDISYACFPVGVPPGSTSAAGEANLSQLIPVAADCSYQLEISFLFEQFLDKDTSVAPGWEVTWLDSNGNVVRTDGETFVQRVTADELNSPLSRVDALLTTPPKAVNADLRFINPASDAFALVIGKVSFTPTQQALRNGNFLQWTDNTPVGSPAGQSIDRSPAGWTLKSGLLGNEADQVEVKLLGNGSDDTVLSQLVDVTGGDTYELRICARPAPPVQGDPGTLPTPQRARLELQWLINGQPGDVAILPLDGRNFSGSAWAGVVPTGVTQAEIRLIQPKGANNITNNLFVESVVLEKIELVPVPLAFLSEAPGQLTVSQMRVAYDVPEAPKPSRRTSIAVSNGGTRTAIAQVVAVPNGKARDTMMPAPQLQQQPTIIPGTGATAASAQAPAASMLPLTSIPGIGEARANQLQAVGIDSLEKLAAATPEDIVQTLKGVKVEMAIGFIKEAQQLIAPPSPGTTS